MKKGNSNSENILSPPRAFLVSLSHTYPTHTIALPCLLQKIPPRAVILSPKQLMCLWPLTFREGAPVEHSDNDSALGLQNGVPGNLHVS